MMGQIAANTAFVIPLDPDAPFAHLQQITQPTLIVNGVTDVVIATINSWHMAQNIPNAQLISMLMQDMARSSNIPTSS